MLKPCIVPIADQRYTTPRIIFDPDSNYHHEHHGHHDPYHPVHLLDSEGTHPRNGYEYLFLLANHHDSHRKQHGLESGCG
jgi:hypothetical protein